MALQKARNRLFLSFRSAWGG